MVLMTPQNRAQYLAMKQQCGQERDVTVKQVEGGYVVQSSIRFFMDQGQGPVTVGEVSDTTIATSPHEAGVIACNFLRYGEFWPEDAEPFAAEDGPEPEFVGGQDPVMPEQHYYREKGTNVLPEGFYGGYTGTPLTEPAIDPPRPVGRVTEDTYTPGMVPVSELSAEQLRVVRAQALSRAVDQGIIDPEPTEPTEPNRRASDYQGYKQEEQP